MREQAESVEETCGNRRNRRNQAETDETHMVNYIKLTEQKERAETSRALQMKFNRRRTRRHPSRSRTCRSPSLLLEVCAPSASRDPPSFVLRSKQLLLTPPVHLVPCCSGGPSPSLA
jgi:hypothetical protein